MDTKLWILLVRVELIVILVMLGGIAKCWSISRRPTTNAKCVLALQLILIGGLIWIGYLCLSTIIRAPFPFVGLFSAISSAIILAAAVLAVVGLREYSRARGRFTQGRAQAIGALVASILITTLPIFALVQARWNVMGAHHAPVGARVLVFEDLNFRFFAPGGRWVQIETNILDQPATFTLGCKRPEIYFSVFAQKAPSDSYSVADFAVLAQRSLSNSVGTVRVVFSGHTRIQQLEGLRVDSQVERSGQKWCHQMRLFVSNGFAYQLISWGSLHDENIIAAEIDFLARQFEPIDYRRLKVGTNSSPTNLINRPL